MLRATTMAPASAHVPPGSPDDWVTVAERALANLAGAYKAEASEDEAVFDETLKRIAKAKPQPHDHAPGRKADK